MLNQVGSVWVSRHLNAALMYGDMSGLSDEDEALVNKFMSERSDFTVYEFQDDLGEFHYDLTKCSIVGKLSECVQVRVFADDGKLSN